MGQDKLHGNVGISLNNRDKCRYINHAKAIFLIAVKDTIFSK